MDSVGKTNGLRPAARCPYCTLAFVPSYQYPGVSLCDGSSACTFPSPLSPSMVSRFSPSRAARPERCPEPSQELCRDVGMSVQGCGDVCAGMWGCLHRQQQQGEPAELTLRLPGTDPEAGRFSILFTGTVISHLAASALLAHLSSQMFLFRLICLYS